MQPTFDLVLLRSFVMVADLKSVSKAAAALHRVQSAISQQIQRIEQLVGGKLFQREKNNFELTTLGHKLYPMATRLLSLNDAMVAQLQSIGPEHSITIGTSEVYASGWLAQILRHFHARFAPPQVRTSLVCDYSPVIWQRFEEGHLDIVLTQGRPETIRGETLYVEPVVWVCAPESTVYRQRPLPLALFGEGCSDRASMLKSLGEAGIACEIVSESSSLAGLLASVQAGVAVTALPQSAVDSVAIVGAMHGLPSLDQVGISIARRADSFDLHIKTFYEMSRLHFQELARQARATPGPIALSHELDNPGRPTALHQACASLRADQA